MQLLDGFLTWPAGYWQLPLAAPTAPCPAIEGAMLLIMPLDPPPCTPLPVPPVFCVPVPNLLLLAPVPILPLSDEVSAMLPGPHFAASGALLFGIDPPLIPPPAVCASAMPPARTKDKVATVNVLDLYIWFLPKNC
jgi:hypothetical protein